ncbi:hypothetical protein ACQI4L_03155 [Mycolicibacterium litorale]|uniref:hypothetical protein n=1 Tax=Mycolicibacterium litorale TaxID=758802 RepID=UPI003CED5272
MAELMGMHLTSRLRSLVLLCCAIGSVLAAAATVAATPARANASVYPDVTNYQSVSSREIYRVVDRYGLWFTSPIGIPCGIHDDGSYGCAGNLPGVDGGENEVAWFVGDPFPRLYATSQPQFDSGAGQTILTGLLFIEYRGSRCSVSRESSVYCIHGDDLNSQLLVTSSNVYRGAEALPAS